MNAGQVCWSYIESFSIILGCTCLEKLVKVLIADTCADYKPRVLLVDQAVGSDKEYTTRESTSQIPLALAMCSAKSPSLNEGEATVQLYRKVSKCEERRCSHSIPLS